MIGAGSPIASPAPADGLNMLGSAGAALARAPLDLADPAAAFGRVLDQARARQQGAGEEDRAKIARDTAEKFVAQTLIQPALAKLREDSLAWGPFKPGPYEKQFAALHDEVIARRIVTAANFPLVDVVARRLRTDLPPGSAAGADAAATAPKAGTDAQERSTAQL